MTSENDLNGIRRDALARIEKSKRTFIIWIAVTGLVEAGCLIAFLLLMDFDNRLHWLLLVTALLIYWTLGFGLIALGAYLRHLNLRLLKAIELLDAGAVSA